MTRLIFFFEILVQNSVAVVDARFVTVLLQRFVIASSNSFRSYNFDPSHNLFDADPFGVEHTSLSFKNDFDVSPTF